ncbi:MAG: hypothetical protein IK015_00115 [Treponema sp.]|nr:hypothetical protein [Treponema sp.]
MIVATIIVVIVVFLLYLYGSKIVNDKNNEMKSSSQVEDPYKSPAINKQSEDEYKKFEQMKRSLSLPDNFASFDCPIKDYKIEYCDRDGKVTVRDITVKQFYRYEYNNNSWWNLYLKSFCHLRNEDRTFHVQDIEHLWIENIEINDIQGYFESIINHNQKWKIIKAISEHNNELKLLAFLSRAATGQMNKTQRNVIAKYVLNFENDLPKEELSDEIKFVTCEMKEFNKLLKQQVVPQEHIAKFMECSAELLMLRKETDSMENAVFQKIKKSLGV